MYIADTMIRKETLQNIIIQIQNRIQLENNAILSPDGLPNTRDCRVLTIKNKINRHPDGFANGGITLL